MHNKHWKNCLSIIKSKINAQSYITWFKPIIPKSYSNKILTLEVPNQFFYEWIENHYIELLNEVIVNVLGEKGKLQYQISSDQKEEKISEKNEKVSKSISESKSSYNNLNKNFRFKSFVSGKCNSVAKAAGKKGLEGKTLDVPVAKAAGKRISQSPGNNPFNPLMIYGGVGLGKTHLIQSIGNKISKKLKSSVYYVTSEKFANQFIDSLKENKLKDFINFYSNIDCLILDDVQFFKGKEKTQEVFFHIFNQLNLNSKQIILAADKSPVELNGLEKRLVSRFKSWLTVELEKPDYQTRLDILKFRGC